MADIRINSLPSTASASSSDDFLALDGATNGTRKLNAYSPTFGGNLTVSGTGNLGGGTAYTTGVTVKPATNDYQVTLLQSNSNSAGWGLLADTSGNLKLTRYGASVYGTAALTFDLNGAATFNSSTTTTVGGNLTVSGTGTSTFGGSVRLPNASTLIMLTSVGASGSAVSVGADDVLRIGQSNANLTSTAIFGGTGNVSINAGASLAATFSPTTTTLAGNLTVSGGTVSVANVTGNAALGSLTVSGTASATGALTLKNTSGNSNYAGITIGVGTNTGGIAFLSNSGSVATERMRLSDTNGNLLVGTTTDNGAKFQVEGYATFNRNGADGYLSVSRTSGATGTFGAGSTNSYLGTATNHPLVLYTNNTTALTLDSSQNATFAGTVTAGNTITSSIAGSGAGFRLERTGASASLGTILNSGGEIIHDYNSFGYSFRISTVEKFNVNATRALFTGNIVTQNGTASTPASASATGTAGTILWDADYIYVCTATNTWKRVAIATW